MIIKSIEASTSFNIFSLTSTSCQTRVTALVLHLIHYSTSRSLTTHKCSIYYTDTNTQESSFPIRLHYHHYTSHILFFSSFWNFILTRRAGSTRWMEWCVASCRRIRIPYRSVSTCRCIWSSIYRDSITRCVLNTRLYSERCVRFVCEKSVGRLTNDEPNSDCETERKRERGRSHRKVGKHRTWTRAPDFSTMTYKTLQYTAMYARTGRSEDQELDSDKKKKSSTERALYILNTAAQLRPAHWQQQCMYGRCPVCVYKPHNISGISITVPNVNCQIFDIRV